MTTRKTEFRSILRVLEIGHIEKVPLACLLVVCALCTNETLDLNIEFNSCFCLFRRECRRRLLRLPAPLDFFLNKVAVSFDIGAVGVSWRFCFFRLENRRRLLLPPPLDFFFFDEGALAVVHMIALVVVLSDPSLDVAASVDVSVISCWITKKKEIT